MSFSGYEVKHLIENVPEALFLKDSAANILDVNEQACRLFGYEKKELLGLEIEEVVPGCKKVPDLDKEGGFGQLEDPIETVGRCKDGKEIPVELKARVLKGQTKRKVLLVVPTLDKENELRKNTK